MASPHDRELSRAGVGLFALSVATFLLIGIFGGGARLAGVAAAAIGLALVPLLGAPPLGLSLSSLGLRRPRVLPLVGAALIGLSFWYFNLRLTGPISDWLSTGPELLQLRTRWVDQVSLPITLLTVALVPAVCEELACRGLLVSSLRRTMRTWLVVVISALVFAALHLSLPRAAPTFALGVVLGLVRLRSGNVWTAMLVHLLNNAVALVALAHPNSCWVVAIGNYPDASLVVAIATSIVGGALVVLPTPPRA